MKNLDWLPGSPKPLPQNPAEARVARDYAKHIQGAMLRLAGSERPLPHDLETMHQLYLDAKAEVDQWTALN